MPCDTVSFQLKGLLDGELGPLASWRVRRHLRRCPACAAEYRSLQAFHALLRAADIVGPAAGPVPHTPLVPRRTPTAWKLAGGALASAALVIALVILPAWHPSPRSMSDAVASALAQVNTWHLSGWKQINGRRVPWDVWGRRAPFLFYEKVGDDITFDDGAQRLRLYPPAPALHRPTGLVIRTASLKNDFDAGGPSVEDMVGLWNWRRGAGGFAPTPYRRTATMIGFRLQYPAGVGYGVNANQLYTVNRFTWLPEHYQLQFSTARFHRDVEDLSASYDVALPRDVTASPIPTGYGRVNFVGGGSLGLTVQATPLDVDQQGNVLIRVRGRLGAVPVTPGSTFTLSAGDYDASLYGSRGGKITTYLPMDTSGYQYTASNGDVLLWGAPLEPPTTALGLSDTLHVPIRAAINVQNTATDFVDLRDQPYSRTQTEVLFTKDFAWGLALPRRPTVNDIQASPAWPVQWGNRMWPNAYYVDQIRASNYYLASFGHQADVFREVAPGLIRRGILNPDGTMALRGSADHPNTQEATDAMTAVYHAYAKEFAAGQRQKRARAVYWLQREIATLPVTGGGREWRLITTQQLALYQKAAGQTVQSRQTLRRLIVGCKEIPGNGLQMRQAKYALRTGQFPSDADYKGPS